MFCCYPLQVQYATRMPTYREESEIIVIIIEFGSAVFATLRMYCKNMFFVSPTVTAITECCIRGVIDTHLYNVFDKTVGNLIYGRNGKKSPSLRSSLVFLRWVFHVTFYFILHIKFPLNIFTRHWFVFSGFEYSTYNSAPHVPPTYENEGIS